jgi:hypothetical protein
MFGLFLKGYLSSSFKGQLNSFFTFKKILEWSKLACFLNVDMQLVVLNMINHFLVWVFGFIFNIGLLWQKI